MIKWSCISKYESEIQREERTNFVLSHCSVFEWFFCVDLLFADQKTLNPIPQFGKYSWEQKIENNGTLTIIINASISSELPYEIRNITVTLGSKTQSQEFTTPLDSIQFEFDGLNVENKTYPLMLNFSLIDSIAMNLFTATNIVNGTVTTTAPAPSMGNGLSAWHFLFLVFLAMLAPLW